MRIALAAAVTCFVLVGATATAQVHAAIKKHTDIPEQNLGDALRALANSRGVQLVFLSDDVETRHTSGAVGDLTVDETLKKLLSGSQLEYRYVDETTIAIYHGANASATSQGPLGDDAEPIGSANSSMWDRFRLAQVDQGPPATVGSGGTSSSSNEPVRLEEVIVTAQKKEERLQDVPESITVLDPQALAENGQNRLLDYFASVPGLNVAANSATGGGTQYITIRGISAGANQNPIVATVIDDVPMTSSLARADGGFTSPDLDPSDLARIEVLKGPQGTLYGADSLGGLIKYVTADPSTQGLSGRVQVSGVDITGGGGLGYIVRGSVNVPVSDIFALRVSGFDRRDPGYIEDLSTGQNNFNSADVYGGHVAALWKPLDNLSVRLSGLVQQTQGDNSLFDSTPSGQSAFDQLSLNSLPGTTHYSTQDQLYSATVNWKVAGVEIVSVTGYVVNTLKNWGDLTGALGSLFYSCQHEQTQTPCSLPPGAPSGIDGASVFNHISTHKPSEELRVGYSVGSWLDWRIGGFYTHEEGLPYSYDFYGTNPTTGAIYYTSLQDTDATQTFQEYATFVDLTAHVTDRFDVELGGRESWNKQEDQLLETGFNTQLFAGGPAPFRGPLLEDGGSAFTYQVAPRFKISPDLMTYVRVATGYRIGGYNVTAGLPVNSGIPGSFAPDKTTNYELGIKGDLLENKLSFDAAIYYIDWKNFQINLLKSIAISSESELEGYTANAGNAKSEGLEFSVRSHPLAGLTISAQSSYDDAELTQNMPAGSTAYGLKGDRLPYSMRFSGGLTINQDIRLPDGWIGSIGGAANYVGSRPYEFLGTPTSGEQPGARTVFPGYTTLNLLAGVRYESVQINLYLNNVTDVRGIVGAAPYLSQGNPDGYAASIIQPRTIGVSVSRSF
jgi:iron complex outermembrane receptor protein